MALPETIIILSGAVLLLSSTFAASSLHVPCSYIDTVNLTDYQKFPNGSYLYDGIIVPANLVGIYDYKAEEALERVPVEPHVRGCVCKLKPCVKVCCPLDHVFNGAACTPYNGSPSSVMNITTKRGDVVEEKDLFQKFAVQIGRPCIEMYHLLPHLLEDDAVSLYENGTLLRLYDKRFLSKDEYCLASVYRPDNVTEMYVPVNCSREPADKTKWIIYAYMMLFSVPFMLLTIIVYIGVPELRTLHGKSLCCYLMGLCVGYSTLSTINLINLSEISQFSCGFLGFLAYFAFMASFFWVSVISFDLFYNIRGPRGRYNEKKRFIMYSIYAWGFAFLFLVLAFSAQHFSFLDDDWKPAIGSNEFCWLNVKYGWSALIYFYAPLIIIICFNITMFILTAHKINSVQKEMSRMMEGNDSQKNLRTEKDRFGIFLRLFIVMGVTWSMEIVSYIVGSDSNWHNIFYITDLCNGIQGFLIFTLFVLKKKVKQYIINRFKSTSQPQGKNSNGTKSSTRSSNLPMNGIGADKPLVNRFTKIHD